MANPPSARVASDISVPLDPEGRVIFFSLNGRLLLFNGQSGALYDTFPPHAWELWDALAGRRRSTREGFRFWDGGLAPDNDSFLGEIRAFLEGGHPDLAPEAMQKGFAHKGTPRLFNIYLSHACNMECEYCFNKGGSFGRFPSLMSTKTARQVLDFIAGIASSGEHSSLSVNLFGGEPLLAPKAAYVIARGLQDLNRGGRHAQVRVMLSTNGTLYRKGLFDVFSERPDLCTVVVSLDAFKVVHDRNRRFRDPGKGSSYDAVLANVRRMDRERIPYSVTCVVPYPYRFVEAAEQLRSMGIRCFEIKPLNPHIYRRKGLPDVFKRDFGLWRRNYLAYSGYGVDQMLDILGACVDRVALIRDYAARLTRHEAFHRTLACAVGDEKIGISSDGGLYPCEAFVGREEFRLGDVREGFEKERLDAFEEWLLSHGQHRLHDEKCRRCFAKLLCGGGCYAESVDKYGHLRPRGEALCRYTRQKVRIDLYYIAEVKGRYPELFSQITGGGG